MNEPCGVENSTLTKREEDELPEELASGVLLNNGDPLVLREPRTVAPGERNNGVTSPGTWDVVVERCVMMRVDES